MINPNVLISFVQMINVISAKFIYDLLFKTNSFVIELIQNLKVITIIMMIAMAIVIITDSINYNFVGVFTSYLLPQK